MKKKYWLILPIVLIVLAYLISSVSGTPVSRAAPGPAQGAAPSETSESQVIAAITSHPADMATATPDLDGMRGPRWTSTSPDGQWIAESVMAFHKTDVCCSMYYTGLFIRSADGKRQWTIIDEWAEEGVGITYPRPFTWSKDGRSFYYLEKFSGDQECYPYINTTNGIVHRVDLDSGMATEVFSGNSLALSPDESTVAYWAGGLVLHDLASGQKREVSIDPGKPYVGQFVWSPDGTLLAFSMGIFEDISCSSTSILLVDPTSLEVQTLLSEDKRFLVAEEWLDPDRVVLKDAQGNRWIWDVQSKTLDSIAP